MSTAFFIGRFQPLHKGHLAVITQLSKNHDLVKIGIGSAQYRNTRDNPLSAAERRTMLQKTLKEARIRNTRIFFIPDIHDNGRWVAHVKRIVGLFDVVHSGNALVLRLFRENGVPIRCITEIQPYASTRIRAAIAAGRSVRSKVPGAVCHYLEFIDAFTRIRKLSHR